MNATDRQTLTFILCAALLQPAMLFAVESKSVTNEGSVAAATLSTNAVASAVPQGIDLKQTSDDPTYGYSKENPVKLGSPDQFGGPGMSRVYLRHRRDQHFKPMEFERDGSFGGGPDGHILDRYTLVDSDGKKHQIYIDMYHPDKSPLKCLAPKGMYFWK